MNEGTEPVGVDELLYRRIPRLWYPPLTVRAFAPHKTEDASGISITRSNYKSIEEAAKGRPGKAYYVAVLRAEDLRAQMEIAPRPLPGDPGHAELPDLNSANRDSDRTQELLRLLVQLTQRVEGPFSSSDQA